MDNVAPLYMPPNITNPKVDLPRMPNVDKSALKENGHWSFPDKMFMGKQVGFVYGIRNRHNGMLYIGKKLYAGMGKLNKGQESNWKYYISSNKEIDAIVRLLITSDLSAESIFDFVCLEEFNTKGGLSFAEVWCLVTAEVPSNRNLFYNSLINGVSWPVKERVSLRCKQRLLQFIKGEI